ncbi:MAG: fasciclin domain-containing protein [Ramlibacter sp.]|uniref:fasciclin domain-containing protein n=1 Tax=Ramlibacter sp. TaxID=1917967 RepID=UPI002612C2BC|nr:fasciclin domain-containing protein [Ramlibacter sp.]MDH4374819.1 fasciclin domain-containing protein [Ramlibacter sp.]
MISRRFASVAVATALSALATVCAAQTSAVSVADALARDPQLSTLNSLVTKAGLTDTLKGAGPFTVFAPTNDAFKAVPQKTLDEVAANPALLKSVLTYHVLAAKVSAADVKNGNVKTVQGANVAVSKAGEFVTVEDAMVQKADIAATNGVIHTVDRVLMPPK